MRVAILVLSDKGSRGEREDLSGPALRTYLAEQGQPESRLELLPDDRPAIARQLAEWCDREEFDLILTCGGTGVSPRDVTPQATRDVIGYEIPGFGERMRAVSLTKSPHAIISRALAGVRHRSLIVNLPGSPVGARENLEAVWPAIPHLVAKLQGDPEDCGAS